MVSVGFTGTRKGMTKAQKALVIDILRNEDFTEYHHGDCIGADKEFHDLIIEKYKNAETFKGDWWLFIHPPTDKTYRAFCKAKTIKESKPYLERNKDIVDSCALLIACPHPDDEINKQRSGTWSTIRYAKKKNKDILIII